MDNSNDGNNKPRKISRASYTIEEFCERHSLSRSTFYDLKNRGMAPAMMIDKGLRRISLKAEREWIERMERGVPDGPAPGTDLLTGLENDPPKDPKEHEEEEENEFDEDEEERPRRRRNRKAISRAVRASKKSRKGAVVRSKARRRT